MMMILFYTDKKYNYIVMSKYCNGIYTNTLKIKKWYYKTNIEFKLVECLENDKLNFIEIYFPKLYGLKEDGIIERIKYYINLGKKEFYYTEIKSSENLYFKDIEILIFNKKKYLESLILSSPDYFREAVYSPENKEFKLKKINSIITVNEFDKYFKKLNKFIKNKNSIFNNINKILYVIYINIVQGYSKTYIKIKFNDQFYYYLYINKIKHTKDENIKTLNDVFLLYRDTYFEDLKNKVFDYYYDKIKKFTK